MSDIALEKSAFTYLRHSHLAECLVAHRAFCDFLLQRANLIRCEIRQAEKGKQSATGDRLPDTWLSRHPSVGWSGRRLSAAPVPLTARQAPTKRAEKTSLPRHDACECAFSLRCNSSGSLCKPPCLSAAQHTTHQRRISLICSQMLSARSFCGGEKG